MEQHPMDPDFDALVLAEIDTIRMIGRSRLRNRQEADDFTQDVILRLYANRTRLRDADRFPQWAAAIARNTSSKWNRKRIPVPVALPPDVPAGGPSSQQRLEDDERTRATLAALHRLEQDDRDILVAHYMDEATYAALEREYGLTRSAVAMRLQRARERLRTRLRHAALALTGALVAPRSGRAFGDVPTRSQALTHAIFGGVSAVCIGGAALAPLGPPSSRPAGQIRIDHQRAELAVQFFAYGRPSTADPGAATGQEAPPANSQSRAASQGVAGMASVDINHTGVIARISSEDAMRKPYLRVDVLCRYAGGDTSQMERLAGREGKSIMLRGLMRDIPTVEEIERDHSGQSARLADAIREELVEAGFLATANVTFTSFVVQG